MPGGACRLIRNLRALGSRGIKTIRRRLNARIYLRNLKGKKGLEIGGPSPIFKSDGILPIYQVIACLDGCNFANETIWEGKIREGWNYQYLKERDAGYQYISDAVDLNQIESNSYDFVLSSHNIEHMANPLKALDEWTRVLKDGGLLLLVVPDKNGTFDHNRPLTSLKHLIDDFEKNVCEDDLTHLNEILDLHDFRMTPEISDKNAFRRRSLDNYSNRCLHHHVFDTELVLAVLAYFELELISCDFILPFNIVVLARCTKQPKADKV